MNMAAPKRNVEAQPSDADTLRLTMRECAAELDTALALKVGVMDSENKARAIEQERVQIMAGVAARLREAS